MRTGQAFKGLIVAFLLVAASSLAASASDVYMLDSSHTSAVFKVKHLAISNVTGTFSGVSGNFSLDKKKPEKSFVEVEIKTDSVNTNNPKRDEDLRSENFFNVSIYPVMRFKSKRITAAGKDAYKVTGDFSLNGVTKTITIQVNQTGEGKDPIGNQRIGFEASFSINRSEYGMKPHMAVGDTVNISFETEGVLQKGKMKEEHRGSGSK